MSAIDTLRIAQQVEQNKQDRAEPPFAPTPDYARIAVLQTERAYLDRELIRAGNHSRTAQSALNDRLTAIDAVIQKELNLD